MTIDINELRRLMQDFKLAGSPMLVQTAQMSELLDRLEAAEKSDAESIAMYRKARDERDNLRAENAALVDDMNLLRNNNTALRAKIAEMEKQAPVRWGCTVLQVDGSWKEEIGIEEPPKDYFSIRNAFPLYALPVCTCVPVSRSGEGFAAGGQAMTDHAHELRR